MEVKKTEDKNCFLENGGVLLEPEDQLSDDELFTEYEPEQNESGSESNG